MYDYIIVGGGPAGSTLARLIGEKHSVLIIEKSTEHTQEKLCGGLIAPDAQRMLGKFGLSLPNRVLVDPQMFYVRSTDLATGNSQKYQRHYLNVNRKKFDNWLLELIPPKVTLLRGATYLDHEYGDHGVQVKVKKGGEIQIYNSKYLVAADGGQSVVRRRIFHDFKKIEKYISIQSEILCKTEKKCYQVYFDKRITDFYGWAIPKGDKLLLGIALKGPDPKKKFEVFLEEVLGKDFSESKRQSCHIIRPKSGRDYQTHYKERVFFIGEAAGFISPSSAEGFSYAFKSAQALAMAIECGKNIRQNYVRRAKKIKGELFLKRLKSFVMYNQLLRNLIFKLGINKL